MRLSLLTLLLPTLILIGLPEDGLQAQAVDHTMVPRGYVRLQVHPAYTTWDRRFARTAGGSHRIEELGDDISSANGADLFPNLSILQSSIRELTQSSNYEPQLGPTSGRVQQEVNSIDFAGEVGIFDWLTVGVVVPWNQTRTVIDFLHITDTINGDLGLNPSITAPASVQTFLGSVTSASSEARANANVVCSGGSTTSCAGALELAARTAAFESGISSAYAATGFFPLAGSTAGAELTQVLAELNTALSTASLSSILPLLLSQATLSNGDYSMMAVAPESGVGALIPLQSRRGLWSLGDVEVSAKFRLADNMSRSDAADDTGTRYRLTGRFGVRLPTGTPNNPDILLDIGSGDAQLDLEGGLAAELRINGRFGIAASGSLVNQRPTSITRRVAHPKQILSASDTRRELRWNPGQLVGIDVAPYLRISSVLSIHGEYRYFQKFRDQFEMVTPDSRFDPFILESESGMKLHEVGGGFRYDTVEPWALGEAPRPMEVHLRFLHAIEGSGGHAPKWSRVEAGIRLFRRFWGPAN